MSPKRSVEDLAIFGGEPSFAAPIHVGAPNIGDRQRTLALIGDALDRRWLTNDGPCVAELERRLAEMLGVRSCVATCNGTAALMLVARALGLEGEVIVPSLTFVATAHALAWQGITPVFCDVNPRTLTLDPDRVEELIGPDTSGILGVHLWGTACDVEGLAEVASRHGLKLVFDAAHALGCSYGGRLLGRFGDAEVFSLHATKVCNAFEGGIVATQDDALADRIRAARNFGFVDYDRVVTYGINAKMPEPNAAMGIVSLESLGDFVSVNRQNHQRYRQQLSEVAGVALRESDPNETWNHHYVVAEVGEGAGIGRDHLWKVLWAENVWARRYFYPGCHRMEPYRSVQAGVGARLPVTEAALERVLSLPTGTATDTHVIDVICDLVRFAIENAEAIRCRIGRGETLTAVDGR